jgi:hypothetical protein
VNPCQAGHNRLCAGRGAVKSSAPRGIVVKTFSVAGLMTSITKPSPVCCICAMIDDRTSKDTADRSREGIEKNVGMRTTKCERRPDL